MVEQGGRIKVVKDGVLRPTLFLDLSASITSGGQRFIGCDIAPDNPFLTGPMAAALLIADVGQGAWEEIDFPGFGLWAWMNNAGWNQLHAQNPEGVAAGNLDGT